MAGQLDDPFAVDDPLSFAQGGLDNDLVEGRTHQVRRLLKGVLHVLRHPRGDATAFVGSKCHGVSVVVRLPNGANIASWCQFGTSLPFAAG